MIKIVEKISEMSTVTSVDTNTALIPLIEGTILTNKKIKITDLVTSLIPTYITHDLIISTLGYTPYNSTNPNNYISSNRTITLSGDITGSGTTSIETSLSNTGVVAGAYTVVQVDAKGRITSGLNPTTLSGYGITDAVCITEQYSNPPWIISLPWGKITNTPTTLLGYGITDAASLNHNHALSSLSEKSYNSLTDKPSLAAVATSGSYNDLTDKPTIIGSPISIANDGLYSSGLTGTGVSAQSSIFIGEYSGYESGGAIYSNFIGSGAGISATNSTNSNFIGFYAGYNASNTSYSNLIGYKAGYYFNNNNIGNNNIIIGTNISLPNATINAINLGGVLFGSGCYADINDDPLITPSPTGKIGIGIVSPTAKLQLAAGTSTINTAPLKFTAGTNLSVPEAGAVEYDGAHLYFTAIDGGIRYQLDQQLNGFNPIPNINKLNSITTAYTIQLSDTNNIIETSATTDVYITIPTDATTLFSNGSEINILRYGTGVVHFVGASGVTIRSRNDLVTLGHQYAGATLIKRDTNEWYLIGDLA